MQDLTPFPIAFFQRADSALYGAKEKGKGQVVAATMTPAASPPTRLSPTVVPPPDTNEPDSNAAS